MEGSKSEADSAGASTALSQAFALAASTRHSLGDYIFFFFSFLILKSLVWALEGRRLLKPDVSPLVLSHVANPTRLQMLFHLPSLFPLPGAADPTLHGANPQALLGWRKRKPPTPPRESPHCLPHSWEAPVTQPRLRLSLSRDGRNLGQDARSGKDPQRGFGLAAPFRQ